MSGQGHNPLLLSKFYLDATDAVKEAMDAEKDANGIRNKRRRLEGKKRLR